jgi:hypothetical protein
MLLYLGFRDKESVFRSLDLFNALYVYNCAPENEQSTLTVPYGYDFSK